jgi:putative endonuclease
MQRQPAVYILASKRNGTLYVGVTSYLIQRIWQHKQNHVDGFTKEYRIHLLVYFEVLQTMVEAIQREKQLKKWDRGWKLRLIEKHNPYWRDLFPDINLYRRWIPE